jgi:RNA polymerase sigma-70 factor (ECF subfamily)
MNLAAADSEASEKDLITQAKTGDRRAFNDLVLQHRAGVVNVVYRMCGDAVLAEDAAQECFIRAWEKLATYRPRAPFRNWLYRIATNCAITMLRREKPTVNIDKMPITDGQIGPERSVERQERAGAVQQAVLALPPASRSVIILREYEGLSYRDIAQTLDIPIGTVMSRLNYARKALRTSLARYMEASP